MPILQVRLDQDATKEFRIGKGETLTIGRKNSNDVVMDNLGVSGHHAKIDSVEDKFLLTDLNSKNGTFVNEKLVTSHWLKDGDIITIGKLSLFFSYEFDEKTPDADNDMSDKTMLMSTDRYQELLSKNFAGEFTRGVDRESVGALLFLAGGTGEVRLTNKLVRVGRDSSCDVVVGGIMTGKTSFTISNRPSGYFLSYVGGFAKPKVNGQTVKESLKLEEFDVVEIGSAKMQFVYKHVFKK